MTDALIGPQRCAGGVAYDLDGNYVRRYGCEVHLFIKGVCAWQTTMITERDEARRRAE